MSSVCQELTWSSNKWSSCIYFNLLSLLHIFYTFSHAPRVTRWFTSLTLLHSAELYWRDAEVISLWIPTLLSGDFLSLSANTSLLHAWQSVYFSLSWSVYHSPVSLVSGYLLVKYWTEVLFPKGTLSIVTPQRSLIWDKNAERQVRFIYERMFA